MKKVIRDGKVAVLYSPGFGAGWYTWNEGCEECIFHPEIVEAVESGNTDKLTDEFMDNLMGADCFYTGGAEDLRIAWLDEGTNFVIDEYDGSESIKLASSLTLKA